MKQNALRTLFIWFVWAGTTIVVIGVLYRDSAVWEFVKNDSTHISQLILTTFALAVIASFILVVLLTGECQRTLIIQDVVSKGGLAAFVPLTVRRAVDRFFKDLKTTLDINGEPDVQALLHTELSAYHRASHAIEVTGNLMITFGLIGTVLGLSITLGGLSSSLEALGQDQVMLLKGLREAMSGMGTAFYTTLLGAVMGGVLLRIFALISDSGVDRLYHMIMRVCLVYCSAEYKSSLRRDVHVFNAELVALHENAKRLQAAFTATGEATDFLQGKLIELQSNQSDQGNPLSTAIERHRRYVEVLREEVHALASLEQSWWARFMSLFGIYRRP